MQEQQTQVLVIDQYSGPTDWGCATPVGIEKRLAAGIAAMTSRAGQNVRVTTCPDDYVVVSLPLGARDVVIRLEIKSPQGDWNTRSIVGWGHLTVGLNTHGFFTESHEALRDEEWYQPFLIAVTGSDGEETIFGGRLVEAAALKVFKEHLALQALKGLIG